MAKHRHKPCWHSKAYTTSAHPSDAVHVAVFSDYPQLTIDRAYKMGLTPHIRRLMRYKPFLFLFWTTNGPST